jgi:hypothetical protein
MSIRAILKGVETRLRSAAVLNDPLGKICAIQETAQPDPNCGQLYYAIHWAGATADGNTRIVEYVNVEHAVTVTITARVGVIPTDRRGDVISASGELLDLAEAIARPGIIHGNYLNVMTVANGLIPGTAEYEVLNPGEPITTNGFEEPLILLGYGPLEEKAAAWVGGRDGKDIFAIPVRFGRARRLQMA